MKVQHWVFNLKKNIPKFEQDMFVKHYASVAIKSTTKVTRSLTMMSFGMIL